MELQTQDLSPQVVRVALIGRLDTLGVDQVEARFNAAVVARGHDTLVDLSQVSFVSSMGVRMLVAAAKAMKQRGTRLVLVAPQPLVAETLQTMGIDTLIAMVPDEAEARPIVGL